MRPGPAIASLATLVVLAGTAEAQTATPLDRYDPTPAGDALLGVPEAQVRGALRPSAGALLSFARSPLVVVRDDEEVGDVVGYQVTLHNLFSLELMRRVKLELDVPFLLAQDGDAPQVGGVPSPSPRGARMGDVRGGARVEVLRQDGAWPGAAIALTGWFPSGDDTAYTSSGSMRFAPALVVGASQPDFVYSATVARRFDFGTASLVGDSITFGAGGGPRFGDLLVSAELVGATRVGLEQPAFRASSTHLEAHLGVRYDLGPLRLQAIAGPGLTTAPGTPDWRAALFVGYVPEAEPRERRDQTRDLWLEDDGDRPADGASRPGTTMGAHDRPDVNQADGNGDGDGDGVPDARDECPRTVGRADAWKPGCPADGDRDGVADARDACPEVPGAASSDPDRDGCPLDRDGDGIIDPEDACPAERGPRSDDPEKSGCPTSVRLVGEQIVILQKVEFATGQAELATSNDALLTEVAQVMNDHPEIVRVAIEGHTDDVGDERANIQLSQRRALAVMRWLIEHGVDERRLESRGYGPRRPVKDNDTPEGRAANRRVDFQVIARSKRGEEAWRDGPIEEPTP